MSKWAGFIFLLWSPVPLQALAPQSHRKLCAPPSKCRPSLHDRTEADSPWKAGVSSPETLTASSLVLLQTAGGCLCCTWRKQTKQHAPNQGSLPFQKQRPSFGHAYIWFTFPLFRGFSKYFLLNACSLDPRWLLSENSFVTSWKSGFIGEVGPLLASLMASVTMRGGMEDPSHFVISEAPWWQALPQSLSFLKLCVLPSGPRQS